MRIEDLHHDEILELDPDSGLIRFAGQRALLLDAVAMGLLRQYLVENFGLTATRAVLTQFGFAHGWRVAGAMKERFGWTDARDWRRAGSRIHNLAGLFRTKPGHDDPVSAEGVTLQACYEAEQHLLHFGRADTTVCWTVSGLVSGFVSRVSDRQLYVLEDRCLGQGHAACHLVARSREEWGDEHSAELAFFDKSRLRECLDVSLSRVTNTLQEAEKKIRRHRRVMVSVAADEPDLLGIVAKSKSMRAVVDLATRVSRVDATVLLRGESGVGKERIARLIHDRSDRSSGPFIAVNCGAISESLLESELFGHARGSFTGAASDRPGLFEAANHGTLLLDEVGEISTGMQVKLLRVLQEREIRRVGENTNRSVDVRILAATNRDVAQDVAGGRFRSDLYYRLKVVELEVPALRERPEDILPLARILLAEAATRMAREVTGLSPRAADQLARYSWPGNVRELENAMERAAALARGARLELDDLPEDIRLHVARPTALGPEVQSLHDVERDYILAVLARNDGNQTKTATQLNIGAATLYRKLKKYREAQ